MNLGDVQDSLSKYREQLRSPSNKLFMAPVKLGSTQQPANGIVDTGSTNTLMPLEVA